MLGLVVLVALVQALIAVRPAPQPLSAPRAQLVLVGVPGWSSLPRTGREAPWSAGRRVAAAVVAEPGPAGRGCGLDVWATLSAGRSTSVEPVCQVTVSAQHVDGWTDLVRAAASARPDARLGTLAEGVPGCVAAVGPAAAVAAARLDGTVSDYLTFEAFLRAGSRTGCPLTLVDPGTLAPDVLAPLLRRPDATVVLLGVRRGASAQAVETLAWVGDADEGWLTSPSTRRSGVVTLPDVTRTLITASGGGSRVALPVDGAQLELRPTTLPARLVEREVDVLEAQPHALAAAASVLAGLALLGWAVLLAARRRRHLEVADLLLHVALVSPAALALTGLQPWPRGPASATALVAQALIWALASGVFVSRCARRFALPAAVLASAVTLAVLTLDAATGGLLQRSSLLELRPLDGGRWYGFGNATSAVYAAAVLVVVGWLVARGAAAAARVLTALALACVASPTMGADLGGVLALAPPLLWLLVGGGRRAVGPLRLVALAAAAVGLGASAAAVDWLRGPQHRTHLGGFVQELLDGTAGAVVRRKAEAVLASAAVPSGILVLALAALCWWYVLRRWRRGAAVHPSLSRVVAAVAATAVLGSLVNDSGVVVGGVVSVLLAVTVAGLAHEAERRELLAPATLGTASG